MSDTASTSGGKRLRPKPPPPPRPPPRELPPPPEPAPTDDWFLGKYMMRRVSQALDELEVSMSSHGAAASSLAAARAKKPPTVSSLFPNTTEAIERERASARAMDPRERARLESWWRRQLMTEGQDPKSPSPPVVPSDPRYAFEARLMHPASAGILRIVLHFSSEFLSSDAATVVPAGVLGADWDLPHLVFAFLGQVEGMMREHPLWAAEHQSSSYAALDAAEAAVARAEKASRRASAEEASQREALELGNLGLGGASESSDDGEARGAASGLGHGPVSPVALAEAESARASLCLEAAVAVRAALSPMQSELDKAWESSCDELEAFVLRKISNALLPPPPSLPKHLRQSQSLEDLASAGAVASAGALGPGENPSAASRRPPLSASGRRLALLQWVTSSHLGVPWGGVDTPADWAPAAAELAGGLALASTPREKLGCVLRTFGHVSAALVVVLERQGRRDANVKALKREAEAAAEARARALSEDEKEAARAVAAADAAGAAGASLDVDGLAGAGMASGEGDAERGGAMAVGRWSDMVNKPVDQPDLPGADDVLPASILVLLAAAAIGTLPHDTLADIEFALAYRRPARLDSEAHYFGITLTSALTFLAAQDGTDLGMTAAAFSARLDEEAEKLGWATALVAAVPTCPVASDAGIAAKKEVPPPQPVSPLGLSPAQLIAAGGGVSSPKEPSRGVVPRNLGDAATQKKVDDEANKWL